MRLINKKTVNETDMNKLVAFKQKIEANLDFFHNFYALIREYIAKANQGSAITEKKIFFEMLSISYSMCPSDMKDIEKSYKKIVN